MGRKTPTRNNRCDPDRVKPQVLDVVKLRFKTFKGATAVVPKVAACTSACITAATSYAIGENEVDAAGLPCIGVCC